MPKARHKNARVTVRPLDAVDVADCAVGDDVNFGILQVALADEGGGVDCESGLVLLGWEGRWWCLLLN